MKTQTRVLTSVAASLAVSALITCIVYFVIRDMNLELARDLYYEDIMGKTYALSLMTARFRGDPDPGLIRQIREVQRSLEKSLGSMSYLDAREESLVRRINTSSGEIGYALEKLILSPLESGAGLETERDNLIVSQLWMKTQFISDDTRRLMEINKSRIAAAQAQTGIWILALIVALTLINGAISFFSGRSIVQIQDGLESQRKWLQVTLASIGDAVIATDKDSRIAFLNPVAAALTGWPIEEALGRPVQEAFRIINEKTREPAGDIVGLVMRDGGKVALANHTALVARNGHEIPIEDSAAPIKDGTGQVTGVVLVFHDVTEKRRAQEALRESEERFRVAQEMSPDGFGILHPERDARGRVVDFTWLYENPALARFNGSDPQAIIERRLLELFPANRGTVFFETYVQVAETGEPRIVEDSYQGEGIGSLTWFRVAIVPMNHDIAILVQDITERKLAEQQLERMRNLLDDGQRVAHVGSFEYVAATQTTVWSEEEYRIYGLDPAGPSPAYDVMLAKYIHPDDAALLHQTFSAAMQSNSVYELEHRIVRHDGSVRWVYDRALPFFDDSGKLLRYVGATLDITERILAEEALRESESRLRHIAQAGRIGIVEWNAAKDTAYWSPEHYELFGFEPGSPVSSERWLQGVHPEDRERVVANAARLLERGRAEGQVRGHKDEYRFIRPDGSVVWLESDISVDMVGGEPIVRGSVRDVTERNEADLLLRASEARFRSLVESNIIGVVVADPLTGEVFDANDAYLRILGCCRDELQAGKVNWKAATPLEDLEQETATVAANLRDGRIPPFDKTYIRRDGSKAHVIIGGSYMVNDPSKVIAFVLDVTERRQAEQTLRESEERISASLVEKEVLLKEIHHRVKNNMQVISSLVALQADGLQDEAMRAVLQDVTHRVRSMALVHEKLYQSPDLARVDFAEYARSLLNYLWRAHGTAASGIRLALDLEPVSLSVDTAVPCGLILNELASNALKHAFRGSAGGEVAVSLRGGEDGQASLCVRDNGVGLPEGLDWKQAQTLGLRLVQMLTGQLHAAVEVSSLGGTEFTITFERPKS